MRALLSVLTAMIIFLSYTVAASSVDTYQFSKPEYETRFQELNKILRCPKCQNQNLADSNSMISQDLRREIFRLIEEGRSDDQIMEYLVMRYGDFVLYKPKFDKVTYFLWLGPVGFAFLGLGVLIVIVLRQRSKRNGGSAGEEAAAQLLSDKEQQALDRILNDNK